MRLILERKRLLKNLPSLTFAPTMLDWFLRSLEDALVGIWLFSGVFFIFIFYTLIGIKEAKKNYLTINYLLKVMKTKIKYVEDQLIPRAMFNTYCLIGFFFFYKFKLLQL